jgi:hypothetical protein
MSGFLILLAMTASQVVDPSPVTSVRPELHTPDMINPALQPYLACLYALRGLPLLSGTDGQQVNYDKDDRDCSATRRRAEQDALKVFNHQPVPGGASARTFVENALSEMDRYVEPMAVRASNSNSTAIVGVPIALEDEEMPAYNRYQNCLKTQLTDTPISVGTIIAVFEETIAICRSVRESAVSEAAAALETKGWDKARSEKAAAVTFSNVDESWLATARQFRESLLARNRR